MRTGLLSICGDQRIGLDANFLEQAALIQYAEELGFGEAWVTDSHSTTDRAARLCFSILSEAAARTSQIKLRASISLSSQELARFADELALLDARSGGRFDLGVATEFAKCTAADQGRNPECLQSGERTRRLQKQIPNAGSWTALCFGARSGDANRTAPAPNWIKPEHPCLADKLSQARLDASGRDPAQFAMEQKSCVIAEPSAFLDELSEIVRNFSELRPIRGGDFVAIRFFHLAATHDQAIEEAAYLLMPLFERESRDHFDARSPWVPWFKLGQMIGDQLIGTGDEIRAKLRHIKQRAAPTSLILAPISPDLDKWKADLSSFAHEIWPATADVA
ncbi:LLM class flavin-dependent oxidoreductase [Methylocapsa acidiphila]|uniref:LLM class flavin-dependent oxidoreductase n=1 Tax=Methylocapsa acidiphila TaxID=133552 RepID=UPI0004021CFC|nr:LLM class flavin-dependent oxidoreductase [Methylocapsa acidiphila]